MKFLTRIEEFVDAITASEFTGLPVRAKQAATGLQRSTLICESLSSDVLFIP